MSWVPKHHTSKFYASPLNCWNWFNACTWKLYFLVETFCIFDGMHHLAWRCCAYLNKWNFKKLLKCLTIFQTNCVYKHSKQIPKITQPNKTVIAPAWQVNFGSVFFFLVVFFVCVYLFSHKFYMLNSVNFFFISFPWFD